MLGPLIRGPVIISGCLQSTRRTPSRNRISVPSAVLGLLIALGLYAALPSAFLPAIQALLLVVANGVALVQLIILLTASGSGDGRTLLLAALQIWVTNIIAFALVFWELDRGGPVARRNTNRVNLPAADFRFPQDEDHDAVTEVATRSSVKSGWVASFVDYAYFSLSNSWANASDGSNRARLPAGQRSCK